VRRERPRGETTTSRSTLSRNPRFSELSPEVGELDREALQRALEDDPDDALTLLVAMTTATDERLRTQVRALAPKLVLDRVRAGAVRRRGVGKPRAVPAHLGGELDLDASLDAVAAARGEGRHPGLDELVARDWGRPELALCLVVDRSGSMSGERLATAAVTAAACLLRAPRDHAVVAFARSAEVVAPLGGVRAPEDVVTDVLKLRGHGMTSVSAALLEAAAQLDASRAARKVTILLSDCRSTDDVDATPAARALTATGSLVVLAPRDDTDAAGQLARDSGARVGEVTSIDAVPDLVERLLEGPS
jgi:Mg-chelatase subunit ChlD